MRKYTLIILLLSTVAHAQHSISALQQDFRFLRKTLEKVHPRPYEFTPKKRFNQFLDSLYARIDHPMTAREFQYFMLPVIAKVHCSHTKLLGPDSTLAPPFKLFFNNDSAWFVWGDNISPGTLITTINGVPTAAFIANYKARQYNEGNNITWTYNRMNAGIYGLFPGLCDTVQSYELNGQTFDAIPYTIYDSLNSEAFSKEYKMFISGKENRAVLTIRSFNIDIKKYEQVIRASFALLQSEGIQNLIIDVRGNIGGKTEAVVLLLQHLMPSPFIYFKSGAGYNEYKKPITPADTRFTGRVLVLADGGCRSSTGFFLAFVKTHNLGKIIGEESCATWSCNDNGSPFTLPNTKLVFNCPGGIYETTCKGLPHGRGVPPDYEVRPTIQDIIAGRDTVMNFANSLIH